MTGSGRHMARRKAASEIALTDEERGTLERLGSRRKVSRGDPTPLRWTKSADDILASIERYCQRTVDAQTAAAAGG